MSNKVAVNNPSTNKKDLVDYIGINGLFIVAIISFFFFGGSIVAMLGTICGIAGLIYLIKRRKILSSQYYQTLNQSTRTIRMSLAKKLSSRISKHC